MSHSLTNFTSQVCQFSQQPRLSHEQNPGYGGYSYSFHPELDQELGNTNTSSQGSLFTPTSFHPPWSHVVNPTGFNEDCNDAQGFPSPDIATYAFMSSTRPQRTLQSTIAGNPPGVSYFAVSMLHIFKQTMPVLEQGYGSMTLTSKEISDYPIALICHPETVTLLRDQSATHQMLHMIVHRLVNDEYFTWALRTPWTDEDRLFKAGVEWIYSFGPQFLKNLIKSTPRSYREALEEGLFCAAVETGSVCMLTTLIEQGFNAKTVLNFCGNRCHPLERACSNKDIQATRVLLELGVFPEQFDWANHLDFAGGHPATIEIFGLLVRHGVKITPVAARHIFKYCDLELFVATIDDYNNEYNYNEVVLSGWLARAMEHPKSHPSLLLKTRFILERKLPDNTKYSSTWDEALTASLSAAASNGQTEIFLALLAAGGRPNTDCLVNAASSRNLLLFERILGLGIDPNACNSYRQGQPTSNRFGIQNPSRICTSLSVCIEEGFEQAFNMLDQCGYLANLGNVPTSLEISFGAACKIGNINLAERLLSLRDKSKSYNLESALTTAVESGQEKIVRYLLSNDVYPNYSSLFMAIKHQNKTLVDLLLHTVKFREERAPENHDIMFEAVRWGNVSIIRDLIRAGVPMDRLTELHLEVHDGWNAERFTRALLLNDTWLVSPLSASILKGNTEVTILLLKSGAQLNEYEDPDVKAWPVMSPLTACVLIENFELLQKLLYRGADPLDNTAIHMAVLGYHNHFVEALLGSFSKRYLSTLKSYGARAINLAIIQSDLGLLKQLAPFADLCEVVNMLEVVYCEDDDVDERYTDAEYPNILGQAIRWGVEDDFKALDILLVHCSDVNVIMEEGLTITTPLLLAIDSGSLTTVERLIAAKANPSLPALCGLTRTPLQAAVECGTKELVDYLLDKGVDPNEPPAHRAGATALQLAAIQGFISIAATLLERGADVNASPALLDGRTAFEGATEHGRIEMMLYLVQNGADLHADDQQQFQRAIKFAEENAQHPAKKLAQKLFEVTRKDGGIPATEEEVGEAINTDLDVSGGLYSSFSESSPFIEQEIAEAIIPNLDMSEGFFPSLVRMSPFPEQEDTEPNLMDLDEHDDLFSSFINYSPGPSTG
jgi:ankyrin repeat protein